MSKDLRVIDFFCGAGGFSEGFRQQGYKVIMGVDNWGPAVQTHNINHNLEDKIMDVLDFENSVEPIEKLPDTEIIIGSPPCVSFSMSNKAGKADKSLGIRLIESYLRFVAVKKHKPGSILKAWLMENVPNSQNFVQESYTFNDLGLKEWAKEIGKKPSDIALLVKNNGGILTASDYGSPQKRQRFVCGEIVSNPSHEFPYPEITHADKRVLLGEILDKMPKPNKYQPGTAVTDPNYPTLKLTEEMLTDQFYDTGVYEVEWRESRFGKENHPFMGKMSFPESTERPSRTIMATRSASTREAIIYRSETNRKGDGEYRLPTIREASTLMGFPYTYQFTGSEGTKWRLIGNAVCPHLSFALAGEIKIRLGMKPVKPSQVSFEAQQEDYKKANNLNDGFKPKSFSKPPKKKTGSKFRRHTIKGGNITVSLMNYNPLEKEPEIGFGNEWYTCIHIGSGKTYKMEFATKAQVNKASKLLEEYGYNNFVQSFEKEFNIRIQSARKMQNSFESNSPKDELSPIVIIDDLAALISVQKDKDKLVEARGIVSKPEIPAGQLMAIYGIGRISSGSKKSC